MGRTKAHFCFPRTAGFSARRAHPLLGLAQRCPSARMPNPPRDVARDAPLRPSPVAACRLFQQAVPRLLAKCLTQPSMRVHRTCRWQPARDECRQRCSSCCAGTAWSAGCDIGSLAVVGGPGSFCHGGPHRPRTQPAGAIFALETSERSSRRRPPQRRSVLCCAAARMTNHPQQEERDRCGADHGRGHRRVQTSMVSAMP